MRKALKDILESATTPKVFFDIRNDSGALFAHFGIALQGVQDVQLWRMPHVPVIPPQKGSTAVSRVVSGKMRSYLLRRRRFGELRKKKGKHSSIP